MERHKLVCLVCQEEAEIVASDWWRGTTYDNSDFDKWGWCRLSCGHKFGFNEYNALTKPDFRLGMELG